MGKRLNLLGFDFGASSGRAMLGALEDGVLTLTEIHRFSNDPVLMNGRFLWDVQRFFYEMKAALNKCAKQGIALDAIGIESAHFMGFSMGCAYVMDLCLRQPERAGRVILLAPGGLTPEMPTPVKLLDSGLFGGIAAALFGIRTVENVLSDCFFDLTVGLNEDVVTEYYKTISDSASRRALRLSIHNFEDETLVSQLRTTEMPVLILLGSEDRWRTSAQTELFHAAIPDAGYAMVRNAGHLLHEEKPDKVLSAVLEFIPVLAPDVE